MFAQIIICTKYSPVKYLPPTRDGKTESAHFTQHLVKCKPNYECEAHFGPKNVHRIVQLNAHFVLEMHPNAKKLENLRFTKCIQVDKENLHAPSWVFKNCRPEYS